MTTSLQKRTFLAIAESPLLCDLNTEQMLAVLRIVQAEQDLILGTFGRAATTLRESEDTVSGTSKLAANMLEGLIEICKT